VEADRQGGQDPPRAIAPGSIRRRIHANNISRFRHSFKENIKPGDYKCQTINFFFFWAGGGDEEFAIYREVHTNDINTPCG
jgi:hypothetical protein